MSTIPTGGFAVSIWDSLDAMQAYEQSAVLRQEMQPSLQPFCVGEYTTYRCDVEVRAVRAKASR
jgi:hypothetical protein